MVNKLKKTNIKYNFFLPEFNNLYKNKRYNYYNEVIKIQNNNELLKNINFINYNYELIENKQLIDFNNQYINKYYFNINSTNDFIISLKNIINILNDILNNKNIIPKNISKNKKIILEYININYFKNKISIVIHDIMMLIEYCEINLEKLRDKLNQNDEYYNIINYIYKIKEKICININYLLNFMNVYDIIKNIYSSKNKNNILFLSTDISNLLIYFLILNLSFEIEIINYSDNLIDNNDILTTNKIIKNIDILNESSIQFLRNYLTNPSNCVSIIEDIIL